MTSTPRAALVRVVFAGTLLVSTPGAAQTPPSITRAELDAISVRGWQMVLYFQAMWMGAEAVLALQPRPELIPTLIARERPDRRWEVALGRLNTAADTFLVAYRAEQTAYGAVSFRTYEMRPPMPDVDFYVRAARALALGWSDFGQPSRRYNAMLIPVAGERDWYVYVLPAQQVSGVWPHGGDIRYRVSADGRTILERRRMHKTILEPQIQAKLEGSELDFVMHSAIMDDRPEDSDVFHAVIRRPRVSEVVVTRSFMFTIDTLGRISMQVRDTTRR